MTITIRSDLRGKFGDVRNQQTRPTCLAFATSDLHAASRPAPFAPLSVEYLFFHAVQHSISPNPKKGITVTAASDTLRMEGQPVEGGWPYLPVLPTDTSKWLPPKGLTVFRRTVVPRKDSVEAVFNAIDNKEAVLLCLKISEAFYRPNSSGLVTHINPDRDTGYHAVLAVGHGTAGSNSVILVRNSWGAGWGLNGHAWLHLAYLSQRLYSVLAIP